MLLCACCSSQFALRSYLYLLFHEIVGRPAAWLFGEEKVRFHLCLLIDLLQITVFYHVYAFHVTVLSFTAVGESVLCCEILSRPSLCFHRDCSCGSSFEKVWETTCFLCTCYAVLNQWLFLC